MPDAWYYWAHNQQHGPVSEADLQAMASAGTLRPEDLVHNESMAQWLPAGQATDWTFGPAPQGAPVSAGTLAYVAPATEALVLSPRVLDLVQRTGPWVRFFAVLGYIFTGLFAVVGVGIIVLSLARMIPRAPDTGVGVGVGYLLIGCVYAFVSGYLNRYASAVRRLRRMKRNIDLEDALDAQRRFWKFCGILMICVLALYALILVIVIAMR